MPAARGDGVSFDGERTAEGDERIDLLHSLFNLVVGVGCGTHLVFDAHGHDEFGATVGPQHRQLRRALLHRFALRVLLRRRGLARFAVRGPVRALVLQTAVPEKEKRERTTEKQEEDTNKKN